MINNVEWININNVIKCIRARCNDKTFSDVNIFKNFKAKKKFLWSHSVQNLEKFRKNQLIPYIKHKPILILEGEYHLNNRSYITSFFGKKVVKLAADYEFINEKIDINNIPEKMYIYH